MGNARLDGVPFRIDPHSVSWSFSAKTQAHDCLGGKVIQVFGTRLEDMTVEGRFSSSREAEVFLERIKQIAARQAENPPGQPGALPVRFLYPGKGWDFLVYLKEFSGDGRRSVVHRNTVVAPRWTLRLFIVTDNTGLTQVAQDVFIKRLAEGIGWVPSRWNGPISLADVEAAWAAAGATTIEEYLAMTYASGGGPGFPSFPFTYDVDPALAPDVTAPSDTPSGSNAPSGNRRMVPQ